MDAPLPPLPQAQQATISTDKLTGYLLSDAHPVGASKARFFRRHGYTPEVAARLADDLRHIARTGTTVAVQTTPFGTKYVVDGFVRAPDGLTVTLRTIWLVASPGDVPRFITAYPA